MTNAIIGTEASKSTRIRTKTANPVSKSDIVTKLLSRSKGATVSDLTDATGWQPHSVRALLSGLRKTGIIITREARKSGENCYRIVAAQQDEMTGRQQESLAATQYGSKTLPVTSDAAVEVA